MVILH